MSKQTTGWTTGMRRSCEGIRLIAAERERQAGAEGWTTEHDDSHTERELARAAESYVSHYTSRGWVFTNDLQMPGISDGPKSYRAEPPPDAWPWTENDWKPKDPLSDLVKAGALIAAEIDRLLRIAEK